MSWGGRGWSAKLRYVAVVDGEPVALVGFARAALKVGVRDAAMGWTPDQRADRLRYVVNNARFVTLPRQRRRAGGAWPPGVGV